MASAASARRRGRSLAARLAGKRPSGDSPSPGRICDLSDGSPTAPVAVPGELMNSEQGTKKKEKNAQETVRSVRLLPFSCFVVPVSVLLFTRCTWDRFQLFSGPNAPPGPADSLVL